MDDTCIPPYSVHDPQSLNSASRSYVQEDTQSFNLTIRTLPISAASGFAQHHGISVGQSSSCFPLQVGMSRSSISPILTTTPSSHSSTTIDELSKLGFVLALSYFELRSTTRPKPADTVFHHMIITPDAGAEHFPFPRPSDKWLKREVDFHDWKTFTNHLFPQGFDNNTPEELEVDAALGLGELGLENRQSPSRSLFEHRPLFKLRPLFESRPFLGSSSTNIGNDGPREHLRRIRIEAIIDEWNEGFFGPRGLTVNVDIKSTNPISLLARAETVAQRFPPNVNQKSPQPKAVETLWHRVVAGGKKSKVGLLLNRGGKDLEALNKKGATALFRALSKGEKGIVQLLLENGVNPNVRGGFDRNTALYEAVYYDRKAILKLLLYNSRAAIEEISSTGETPLYLAVKKQRKACIEVLLNHGADPNSRPVGQESMLSIAVNND
jgi:hypothetical protein